MAIDLNNSDAVSGIDLPTEMNRKRNLALLSTVVLCFVLDLGSMSSLILMIFTAMPNRDHHPSI